MTGMIWWVGAIACIPRSEENSTVVTISFLRGYSSNHICVKLALYVELVYI
jgi:hypothetical protein